MAYVVRRQDEAGAALTGEGVMAAINGQVAPYKRLRDVVFVDALPVSPAGKVLKRELSAREREAADRLTRAPAPLSGPLPRERMAAVTEIAEAFYLPLGEGRFAPTKATESPWDSAAQHGGPPSALLAHLAGAGADPGQRTARVSVDFLGAIPRRELTVEVSPVRPAAGSR